MDGHCGAHEERLEDTLRAHCWTIEVVDLSAKVYEQCRMCSPIRIVNRVNECLFCISQERIDLVLGRVSDYVEAQCQLLLPCQPRCGSPVAHVRPISRI